MAKEQPVLAMGSPNTRRKMMVSESNFWPPLPSAVSNKEPLQMPTPPEAIRAHLAPCRQAQANPWAAQTPHHPYHIPS